MADKKHHDKGKEEKGHAFWNTQPVLQRDESAPPLRPHAPRGGEDPAPAVGAIDRPKTIDDIPKEPTPIASTFEWWVPDLNNAADVAQIYNLLTENYVEDDDAMFRFKYSSDFLQWVLTPPGYRHDWHVGVRKKSDQTLLAFISGIPITVRMVGSEHIPAPSFTEEPEVPIERKPVTICEINFLCVHKRLREKRMAPILIKEVTRRVNLTGIWQAVYTAGVVLTKPFSTARYYHRSLNPDKLVAVSFSSIPPQYQKFSKPMEMLRKNYALPDKPQIPNLRLLVREDIPVVTTLLNNYLKKFPINVFFSEADALHWFLPRRGVIWSFVVADPEKGNVPTDFVSFYSLPSSIIGPAQLQYDTLFAAYSFYYAATTVPVKTLFNDALICAKQEGFDVFNTLDIIDNESFIHELKFGLGDGHLQYYLYNWKFPTVQPGQVGLVMM